MNAEESIARWVRPELRAIRAYHVPDASGLIKLDAMENPYPWPAEMLEEWVEVARTQAVNRYPDPDASAVKQALRVRMGLDDRFGLLLGNGSDEIIQMLAMSMAGPGRSLLAPEPSFVMYRMIAEFTGMQYVGVPLNPADFSLDLPAMLDAIETHHPALVFLAVPNNPTGNCFDERAIRAIVDASPGLVVIDEAYTAFSDGNYLHLLESNPQVLVMRTLSKEGLAGLRLGMLAGDRAWLEQIDKIRLPYNINVLSQAAVRFALAHETVFEAQTRLIRAQREKMIEALRGHAHLQVWSSAANFVLVRAPEGRALEIHAGLRQAGILIKCLHGSHPMLEDCLRITVGTEAENQQFLQALDSIL